MRRIIAILCACSAALAAVGGAAAARTRHHHARLGVEHRVSGLDKEYLKTSMEGDLFEIIGGKLAKGKSNDAAVLRLANRLVSDHTMSFKDSAKLARRLGVEVPASPTPSEVWELKMVRTLSGKAFDHWYSSLEVYDHRQDIQEATDEVQDGSNRAVRENARTELPTLHQHLELAEAALSANP